MGSILRVDRVISSIPWALDDAIREVLLPSLAVRSGLLQAWAGRRGPETDDARLLATLWDEAATSGPAAGLDSLEVPGLRGEIATETAGVVIQESFQRAEASTILRVYDGRTRPGELAAYIDEARIGVRTDGRRPDGPATLWMGVVGPDRFLTVSTWSSWASIASCTGGDVDRPLATRNAVRLVAGRPTHYELLR